MTVRLILLLEVLKNGRIINFQFHYSKIGSPILVLLVVKLNEVVGGQVKYVRLSLMKSLD